MLYDRSVRPPFLSQISREPGKGDRSSGLDCKVPHGANCTTRRLSNCYEVVWKVGQRRTRTAFCFTVP